MAFKFFVVPVSCWSTIEDELNAFIAAQRVLSVDRRFVDVGENSYWAICVD